MSGITLEEALNNMCGGCGYNFDGSERKPGNYTDLQANIEHWTRKYGNPPPQDVIDHWSK